MYNPFSLDGKTILVTGASSGIGRGTAVECSKLGANLIITGRNTQRLEETYNLLEGEGHIQIVADMTSSEEIEKLVDLCDKIDGVSHNVGIAKNTTIKHIKRTDLDNIIDTNTISPIMLTCLLLKKRKINKGASIVFTSSLSGIYCVHYGESMYATSKGALNGFAKGAALDLAKNNIRVNCVNPSIVETNIFDSVDLLAKSDLHEKIKYYPLKRFGQPEDVAWAIIYLLSDASSWVTGIDIKIDGGYTLI